MHSGAPPTFDPFSREVEETALVRLFIGADASPDVAWFSLPGGRTLYTAGDAADTLYFLRAGRLGVVRRQEGHPQQFLGVVKPGEPVGEMALISGTDHTATVVAMRDSEILALPRKAFFEAARREPALMGEMARLTVTRSRQETPRTGSRAPTVFGLLGLTKGRPIRPLAEAIERKLIADGFTVAVLGVETLAAPTEWFSSVELGHEIVLFVAEREEDAFIHLVARQVDRLWLIGCADGPPGTHPALVDQPMHEHRLSDLVLIQAANAERPKKSAAWRDAVPSSRLFQIREGNDADLARLARVLAGTSVGLVLSGGGARAYAHLGVIRALREAGEPIDFIGGASMGAIIAAGVAMGWDEPTIERSIREAFVDSSPLADIALPMIAMTQGRLVHDRLEAYFHNVDIEDLWLPFYCVSSNLTTGEFHVHQRGRVRKALRASSSLPGIMPPVIEDGNVLVDGAVLNNLPSDVMRRWHRGPVVGIDVAVARPLTPNDVQRPKSMWAWFLSGEWRKGPPIVSLLIRAATLSSGRDMAPIKAACDVMLMPKIDGVELRDWKSFDPAVEAGYKAMKDCLSELERPLCDLTRKSG